MKTSKNVKNKNKTRKVKRYGGDKKNVESCMNTKCQLWLEQAKENVEKMKKNISKTIEEKEKQEKKICGDNKKKEQCEKLKNSVLFLKGVIESLNKDSEKIKNTELDTCKNIYCNKDCKDTIFEDGNPDTLPKGLIKKYKKMKDVLEIIQKTRKEMFKNKKTVLNNGFYQGLKSSDVKKLEKEGAISGCSREIPKPIQ
jgi:hypothetical protein